MKDMSESPTPHERRTKDLLYEQVARVGKALASPKRLEILELLAQAERAVEAVARAAAIDVKLASAHLLALRAARLVDSRRDGKRVLYRLSGADVAHLAVALRAVAGTHLLELQQALQQMAAGDEALTALGRKELLARARRGEVVVIDVRPAEEYAAAHLPHARSLPLPELAQRLAELPRGTEIVAYCRGPFCLMSDEAVRLLRAHGFTASKTRDGVAEWHAAGLALAHA